MSHLTRRRLVKALARLPRCPECEQIIRTTRNRYAYCLRCHSFDPCSTGMMPHLSSEPDEKERAAFVELGGDAHDGAGWYFVGEDYPDEGSFGAYATLRDAKRGARENGYRT